MVYHFDYLITDGFCHMMESYILLPIFSQTVLSYGGVVYRFAYIFTDGFVILWIRISFFLSFHRRLAAEKENAELRNKLDRVNDQIGEYEGEIATLRGRIDGLENEVKNLRGNKKRLEEDIARLRAVSRGGGLPALFMINIWLIILTNGKLCLFISRWPEICSQKLSK